MAIKVQNNGGIGNPYHSEANGQFVSAEYASGNMKPGDVKNYDKASDSFDDDIDWDALFSGGDQNSKLNTYWNNKQKGIVPKKNIEEMTNEELIKESKECYDYFVSKGLDLSELNDCYGGDLKIKCANFRQLKTLMETYPIDFNGFKLVGSDSFPQGSTRNGEASTWKSFSSTTGFVFQTEIVINKKKFVNYDAVKQDVRRVINDRWWADVSEGNEVIRTISHEYGHLVHGYLLKKMGYFEIIEERVYNGEITGSSRAAVNKKFHNAIREYKKEFVDEIKKEFLKQNPGSTLNDFFNENSDYGKQIEHPSKRADETFAEAFASLTCGKPNKIALAMQEVLKKYF